VPVIFALFLVGSVIAEDEVVEDESNVIIDVVLPVALAFIMFSLGIGLTVDDFTVIVKEPKAFAIGLTNQMIEKQKADILSKGKKTNSKMNSDAKGKVGKAAEKFVDKFLESLS